MSYNKLIRPRIGDERKTLRILLSTRAILVKQQTMEKNALNALVRSVDIGIDARRAIGISTIRRIAASRTHATDTPHQTTARTEAIRLSSSIVNKEKLLYANEKDLRCNVNVIAPGILNNFGMGPVCAAHIICAYSHKGRVRSAAAFASLAGVAPLPASSGNIVRHRLSRQGDRTLNQALDVIALSRIRADENTQEYVEKRTASGSSYREIKRTLKRYIARSLFKELEKLNLGVDF